jgi:hypothetical protein
MVDVLYRCVAVGCGAAIPVAGPDQRLEETIECAPPGFTADDDPVAGDQSP